MGPHLQVNYSSMADQRSRFIPVPLYMSINKDQNPNSQSLSSCSSKQAAFRPSFRAPGSENGIDCEARVGGQGDGPDGIQRAGDPSPSQVRGRPEPVHHEERQGTSEGGRHPYPSGVRERSKKVALMGLLGSSSSSSSSSYVGSLCFLLGLCFWVLINMKD